MTSQDALSGVPPVAMARCPTITELLQLPVLARGLPKVVAGQANLHRRVRWIHVTEWASPASALRGGEVVLTTGLGFPDVLDHYVAELADVDAAGLILELGRRYREVPEELRRGCREREIPLVVLERGVKFLDVTQEVHALILGSQVKTLRDAHRVHDAFTALTLRGADAGEVVQTAATMTGRAVVLENLTHQAVVCRTIDHPLDHVLSAWEQRSRATRSSTERTDICEPEGWLVTSVEHRGQRWGRLVMLPREAGTADFHIEHGIVLERAAVALTIARLTSQASWERQAHRTALLDVIEQRYGSITDAHARVEALGVPTRDRSMLVVLVCLGVGGDDHGAMAEHLARALTLSGAPALVGELGPSKIGVLLPTKDPDGWRPVVERIGDLVRARTTDPTISVGAVVDDLSQVPRSFSTAEQVAQSIPPGTGTRSFHTLADIGLPQLLYSLREDLRVQEFAERQLCALLEHDSANGTDLLTSLWHYLVAAGNKSIAAKRHNLSRQAFYRRLHTIEQLLDCDLESGEQRAQLHVAIAALQAQRHDPT
jgi:PucR family transcriptional regulator, purine catabolism regulatory protein